MHFFFFLVVFFAVGLVIFFDKTYTEETLIGQLGMVGSISLAVGRAS